jgi:hypothetical protein
MVAGEAKGVQGVIEAVDVGVAGPRREADTRLADCSGQPGRGVCSSYLGGFTDLARRGMEPARTVNRGGGSRPGRSDRGRPGCSRPARSA